MVVFYFALIAGTIKAFFFSLAQEIPFVVKGMGEPVQPRKCGISSLKSHFFMGFIKLVKRGGRLYKFTYF